MGGLFGGSGGNSAQQEVYAGIQVSTSLYSGCIPYVAGRQRVPMNLLWFGAFQVHTSNSGGGKGGGGNGTKQYAYSAAFIAGLCIGPIQGVTNIWHDKALVNLTFEGLALSEGGGSFVATISGTSMVVTRLKGGVIAVGGASLTGPGVTAGTTITSGPGGLGTYVITPSQTVSSPVTMHSSQPTWTGYPSGTATVQKIPYANVAYVASSSYNLGSSAAMPNLTYEVEGTVPGFSDANSIYDADPSAVFLDYLLDPVYGALANYPGTPLTIGSSGAPQQGATNSYQSYVMSVGLLTSPYEDTQRQATDFISELLQTTNSTCRLSVGTLEILPYADQAVSATVAGTAFSYTPNLTPVYSFTDDDYCPEKGDAPLKLTRVPQSDTYNTVSVEYNDRSNYYNQAPVTCSDLNDIALYGPRVGSQLSWHQITQSSVALLAGQFWLTRQLYERNSWASRVRADYALLEAGDYIAHNDANLGLAGQVCQITQIEDDAENVLTLTALELPGVTRSLAQYNWSAAAGYFANYAADPGAVQAPAIFVMPPIPAALSEGITIGIAVCGQSSNAVWLGCDVYCSVDGGTTYQFVGTIPEAAHYGALFAGIAAGSADPDTTNTLSVALANTNLQLSTSVTHADADSMQTLMLVGSGATPEVLSYGTAALVTSGEYNLTYLRRGVYGSTNGAHTSGASFVRLDGAIFQIAMDPGYAGQTVDFKFVSFNLYKQYGPQTLASSTAYSYTIPSALPVAGNLLLIPRGTCAVNGNNVYKQPNGATAWDSDAYSPQGFLNGCFISWRATIGFGATVGFSKNPAASVNFTSVDFGIDLANSAANNAVIVEAGTLVLGPVAFAAGDSFEIRYDGVTVRYFQNGALLRGIRAAGATLYPKVCAYSPGAVVSNVQYGPASAVNQPSGSWLNTYPWVIGSTGNQGNYLDTNGVGHPGAIILGNGTATSPYGPYGTPESLWEGNGGTAVNQYDVGWLNTGDTFGVDSTKTYRLCVWFRYHGTPGGGQVFLGGGGVNMCIVGTQTPTGNTWMVNGELLSSLTADKWYLLVGFIHGSGYTGVSTGQGGLYDPDTGTQVTGAVDYNFLIGAPSMGHQVVLYSSTAGGSLIGWFAKPRYEEVNGNEPSIATLISPAGALAYADNMDEVPDGPVTGRSASRWFTFAAGSVSAWYKLGTWVAAVQGDALRFEYMGGIGFNTNGNQQSHSTAVIRNGNQGTAPNLSGISWWENGDASASVLAIKAAATGGSTSATNQSWDIYAEMNAFTNGQFEFVVNSQAGSTFTWNGAGSSDPGAASTTVVVGTGGVVAGLGASGIDAIYDGTTYGKTLAAFVAAGVPFVFSGSYSGSITYKKGSEVSFGGQYYLYINATATAGNSPPNTTYWQIMGSPTTFVATGNCVISDTNAAKIGGTAAWDSCVYSLNSYTTCHIAAKPNGLGDNVMLGFATSPTATSSYTNMNYGWFNAAGTWTIYESGTNFAGANTAVSLSDVAAVTYDGSTITYLLNGVSKRTVSVSGLTLYGFCPFDTAGSALNSLSFGPTTNLAILDTSQINANAVSQVVSATSAGGTVYSLLGSTTSVDLLTCAITSTGGPVGIDVNATLTVAVEHAALASPINVIVTRDGTQIGTAQYDLYDYVTNIASSGSVVQAWTTQITLTVMDSPSAAAHTYAMHLNAAAATAGSGTVVANIVPVNMAIKLREYKK